jgi:hypothetical protein
MLEQNSLSGANDPGTLPAGTFMLRVCACKRVARARPAGILRDEPILVRITALTDDLIASHDVRTREARMAPWTRMQYI